MATTAAEAETARIVGGARRVVIGQLLLPSMDQLKAMPGKAKLGQAQFFRLIGSSYEKDTKSKGEASNGLIELQAMDSSPALKAVESAVKYSLTDDGDLMTISDPQVENVQMAVWADVVHLVHAHRKKGSKSSFAGAPKNSSTFQGALKDAQVEAQELIALAASASESPVISTSQAQKLLTKLEEFEDEDELDRNQFVVLVRQWSVHDRELDALDLERLTLYLFPELEVEIYILRKLVAACAGPSLHTNFTAAFATLRMEQLNDMWELMIYAPFLILFLFVVFSGKFVTPRTYYGADATAEVLSKLFESQFTQVDHSNFSSPLQSQITSGEMANFDDIYAFLYNGIGQVLWTDPSLDASSTVFGRSLSLVGAIKLRNMRVLPVPSPVLATTYFGNDLIPRYPGLDSSNIDPTNIISMNTTSYAQFVLKPWDGSTFGTCKALNGSGNILASTYAYGCSGNAVVVPFRRTQSEYKSVIEGLAANEWIGASTRAITVEFHLFHPISTMLVFVGCVIEVRAGGGLSVTPKVQPYTFYTLTSSSVSLTAAFYVFFVYLLLLFIRTVPLALRPFFPSSNEPIDYWRIWDAVNQIAFIVSAILRITFIAQGTPSDPIWLLEHYPAKYESTQELFNIMSTVDSFNVILSVLALLRYTKFVPGLDVVVNSLYIAAPDAAALIFIIAGTFMSFVLCANTVFGDQVYGYHTIPWACETLGQVFMGNYNFSSLHAAHPTFAFIFFFFFNIMLTMILLSCFVAVFTDAFGAARESEKSTSGDQIQQILSANPRHNFTPSTVGSKIISSSVIQYIRQPLKQLWAKMKGEAVDESLSFREYYREVKKSLDDVFAIGSDAVKPRARVEAAHVLLSILDEIPNAAGNLRKKISAAEDGGNQTTTIYDFMQDQLGKFDYPLCLAFFVLAPQSRFSLPGEDSITQLLGGRAKWFAAESGIGLKASDVDWLELRVRAIVEERTRRNSVVSSFTFGEGHHHTAVSTSCSGDDEAVRVVQRYMEALDYIHRRLFTGLACLSTEEEIQTQVLTKEFLATLVGRCAGFPVDEFPPEDVWEALRLERAAPMHMSHVHAAAFAELSEQCLSLDLSVGEISDLQKAFETVSATAQTSTVTPRPEDAASVTGSKVLITRDEFVAAWKILRGTPSDALVNKIFSIFPSGLLDVSVFLSFARGNLSTHRFKSLQRSFTDRMESWINYLMWFIFYIPFVCLILYFVDIQHGDHIWIVEGMIGAFPTSDGVEVSDVEQFMMNAVSTIYGYSSTNGPGTSASLNGANFYVGAVRFRQHRVRSVSCTRQFEDYFGEVGTKQLRFPSSTNLSAADRQFYSANVKVQYDRLVNNLSCYAAWDLGLTSATQWDDQLPVLSINSSIPEVLKAFQYTSGSELATSDPVYAHDSEYPEGGFGLVLNTTVPGTYASQAVSELLANKWIDDKTRLVVLEFISLNFNLELYCRVRIGYEITGGGAIRAVNSMYIVDHNDITSVSTLLPGFLMLFFIIAYLFVWARRFVEALQTRVRVFGDAPWVAPAMALLKKPLLLVDAVIIGTFITTFIMRYSSTQHFQIVGDITNGGHYATQVEASSTLVQTMLKLMGVNVLLVFLRFLEIVSTMQPRIATFYTTLQCASKDLLSIISLWIFSLFAFTLSGVILFGYGTPEAFNLQQEFFDLFNTASGGNVNYYDYTISRRIAASAFFGMCFIVCFFVLYNMVVAVLTEQYSLTKGGLYDDSVARSILGKPKSPSWRNYFKNHLAVRAVEHFIFGLHYGDQMPLALRYRSPQRLWKFLAAMWRLVDVGEPSEVVLACGKLMALSFAAERHLRKEQDELESSRSVSSRVQPRTFAEVRNSHRLRDVSIGNTKLRTIADRRQPLWEEFVFYRFGNERDCVHRYLVWLPSVLLGTPQSELWLQLFEEDHYFTIARDVYTVDLSESKIVQICKILPEIHQVALELETTTSPTAPLGFTQVPALQQQQPPPRGQSVVLTKSSQQEDEDETTPFVPTD